jgi:hypothetical protein
MNFHTYRKKDKDEDYQEVKVINLDSKSSNIYYTASVVNNLTYNPPDPVRSIPKEARITFTKNNTILSHPDDFRVCVTRCSIPSASIPLFLFPKEEATYTITLSYNDGIAPVVQETVNVVYVNTSIGNIYQQYQPVYYIQEMLNFINSAFLTAYNNIVTAVGGPYTPTTSPVLRYNQETKLIELVASSFYEDIATFGIFMNKPLFDDFFSGLFSREVLSGIGGFNGVQLLVQDYGDNNVELPSGSGNFFDVMLEEFSSTPLFYKADRIIVSSNMIPVQNIYIATQRDVQLSVLLDFILEDTNLDRRRLEYKPEIYKWYDLIQQQPLKQFDLLFNVLYDDGQIIPLYINGNSRIDITLLFTPKGSFYQ